MKFSFEFIVDPANKLLICEVNGESSKIIDIEHMLKTIVKMAGKNQMKHIVLDVTNFKNICTNIEIAELMISIQDNDWLGDLKVARVIKTELNIHNVIERMADNYSLSIKNFESRSEAMLWLLFDKIQTKR